MDCYLLSLILDTNPTSNAFTSLHTNLLSFIYFWWYGTTSKGTHNVRVQALLASRNRTISLTELESSTGALFFEKAKGAGELFFLT